MLFRSLIDILCYEDRINVGSLSAAARKQYRRMQSWCSMCSTVAVGRYHNLTLPHSVVAILLHHLLRRAFSGKVVEAIKSSHFAPMCSAREKLWEVLEQAECPCTNPLGREKTVFSTS